VAHRAVPILNCRFLCCFHLKLDLIKFYALAKSEAINSYSSGRNVKQGYCWSKLAQIKASLQELGVIHTGADNNCARFGVSE